MFKLKISWKWTILNFVACPAMKVYKKNQEIHSAVVYRIDLPNAEVLTKAN